MKLSLAYMCIYRYIYIQICLCVCNHVAKVSDNGCHIDKHILSGTTPLVIDWAEVFKTGWWMAHFGSISPKRHVGLSNNPWCDRFNIGKLHKAQRMACKGKTSVRKVDKATGKVTYQGTSQLKSTQNLASTYRDYILLYFVYMYMGFHWVIIATKPTQKLYIQDSAPFGHQFVQLYIYTFIWILTSMHD